MRLFILYF